jgi:hypothetical protein
MLGFWVGELSELADELVGEVVPCPLQLLHCPAVLHCPSPISAVFEQHAL